MNIWIGKGWGVEAPVFQQRQRPRWTLGPPCILGHGMARLPDQIMYTDIMAQTYLVFIPDNLE